MSDDHRLGAYRLLRLIARGGMGEVWEACPAAQPDQRVALKTLHRDSELALDVVRRFESEARIGTLLHHPNLARTLDFGVDAGRPFLVMELLTGWTLARLLPVPGAQQPWERVVAVARQVIAGLEHAQTLRLVHRDLKPSNLFLCRDGVLKLIDFGIARVDQLDATLTASGVVRGSIRYLSPEQARGEPLDARSDLYALGLMMLEWLVGECAFPQRTDAAILSALLFGSVPSLEEKRPGLPAGLYALVASAVSKDPAQRPATARAFGEALEALLADDGGETLARWRRPGRSSTTRRKSRGPRPAGVATMTVEQGAVAPSTAAPSAPPPRRTGWKTVAPLAALVLAAAGAGWVALRGKEAPASLAPVEVTPPQVAAVDAGRAELWSKPPPRRSSRLGAAGPAEEDLAQQRRPGWVGSPSTCAPASPRCRSTGRTWA
ncbi:MAG: protein kinase [Archangiaceae bacterium]|nr:protein kinase [Archangiaceae bacterium]